MAVPILLYHHIGEPPARGTPARSIWVRPQNFIRQMKLLKWLGYQGLSLRKAIPYIKGEKSGKVVVITFDDGAMSVYQQAMPVLDQLGFTATNFFVADHIGGINDWDKPPHKHAPIMGITEMRQWAAHGHEAGGHTLSHPHLPQLPPSAAREEIIQSKEKLEALLGFELVSFAYPYGEETPIIRDFVREAGYSYAVTTERGMAFGRHSLLGLPRHSVRRNDSLLHFTAKCLWRRNG